MTTETSHPSATESAFTAALRQRVLVIDGAMGTMLQRHRLTEEDFRGDRFRDHDHPLAGANDILVLTQPDIVKGVHRAYLDAGADLIETNTFNATSISLADYALEPLAYEINAAAARVACAARDEKQADDPSRQRFVAGAIGPTNKTASLSPDVENPAYRAITFQELVAAYADQVRGLIDGGSDVLIAETTFDTLNLKAALFAIEEVFADRGARIPVLASVTITDRSGRTLSGQTLAAFHASIGHIDLGAVGINCALGAEEMRPHVEELSRLATTPTFCYPNAGLPNEMGEYDQSPEQMGALLNEFLGEGWLNLVGGCCGTTPEHIAAIAEVAAQHPPRQPAQARGLPLWSGLEPYEIGENVNFTLIGERTNVTGSRRFKRLIKEGQMDKAVEVARGQVEGGANALDVNMDEGLLDSEAEMTRFLNAIAAEPDISRVPIMIDSSRFEVIEAGLRCVQGKGIVNSISLKEGEEAFLQQAERIQRYGAAVVVMAFDEEGQAVTCDHKVAICGRAYDLLVERAGFKPSDIIFDPNILTVGTGIEEHATYAIEFLEAIPKLKARCPSARISGGVSNLSFAFRGNETVRRAMHSAFLKHAIAKGMDMAIVNAGQLDVYDEIDKELLELVEDVIFNRNEEATERLIAYGQTHEGLALDDSARLVWRENDLPARVLHALLEGNADFITEDMEEALGSYPSALSIIEGPLMDGMNVVGERFGDGRMFLPQVVKSARVMKKAVAHLEPHMQRAEGETRGKILMATVKGDVHDIGKNIVGVVLACNGYEVVDLGVMVPTDKILNEAQACGAHMVGLSGLITPSLDEMVHVAKEMERREMKVPLLIGGATTSAKHTAVKIAENYSGPVLHIADASRCPPAVEKLRNPRSRDTYIADFEAEQARVREAWARTGGGRPPVPFELAKSCGTPFGDQAPAKPEHLEQRTLEVSLEELVPYIDWTPFFHAWEIRGTAARLLSGDVDPRVAELKADADRMLADFVARKALQPKATYGFFPAARDGEDVVLYADEARSEERCRYSMLRRQEPPRSDGGRPKAGSCPSLVDLIATPEQGPDYLGAFVVTSGHGLDAIVEAFEADHDDYQSIMAKALADRLAEAMAEWVHERMRREWGYGREEGYRPEELFREDYRGIRPAPGYPAQPDHTEKRKLFTMLGAEQQIGVSLTESCAMLPAASVSALVFAHPDSRYFSVGRVARDQVHDYAARKGLPIAEVERWLAPVLAYEPSTPLAAAGAS